MRTICLFVFIFISCCLTGCATSNIQKSNLSSTATKQKNQSSSLTKNEHNKNPMSVAFYTGENKPQKPYMIVGKETVSKYNKVGVRRQEAHIRDSMRYIAAKLGGDAVIDISHDANSVSGTVIAYKNMPNESHNL